MALCQEKVNKSLKSYNRSGLSGIHKCAHQMIHSWNLKKRLIFQLSVLAWTNLQQ
ncbi:hypothetical protein CASFOL_011275 [Castilleja foliolosa]|uniref:Ribosomal protein S14 n=1 Tax=Castilleja foliolosa TaxID=1961234 RepID=A0ABD3DV07_9LAMI